MVSLALTAPVRAQAVDPSPPNLLAQAAAAPSASGASAPSALSFSLPRIVTGGKQGKEPMYFEADHLEGEAGERTRATGKVRLRQGDLSLQADELTHTQADNTARAVGKVRIERQGNIFMGPELSLQLDRLEVDRAVLVLPPQGNEPFELPTWPDVLPRLFQRLAVGLFGLAQRLAPGGPLGQVHVFAFRDLERGGVDFHQG